MAHIPLQLGFWAIVLGVWEVCVGFKGPALDLLRWASRARDWVRILGQTVPVLGKFRVKARFGGAPGG